MGHNSVAVRTCRFVDAQAAQERSNSPNALMRISALLLSGHFVDRCALSDALSPSPVAPTHALSPPPLPHPQAPHIASFDFVHATCFIARLQARQQHAHRAAYSAAAAAAAAAAEAADPDPRVVAKVSATMCQAAIKYKMEDFINSVAGPPQGSGGGGRAAAARASVPSRPRGGGGGGNGGGMVVPPPRSAGGGGSGGPGAGGGTASTTTSGLMEVRLRNHLKRIGKGSLRQYGLSVGLGWTLLELVNADVAVRVDQVGSGDWTGAIMLELYRHTR